jgi:hypothetical protein
MVCVEQVCSVSGIPQSVAFAIDMNADWAGSEVSLCRVAITPENRKGVARGEHSRSPTTLAAWLDSSNVLASTRHIPEMGATYESAGKDMGRCSWEQIAFE